MDISSIGSSVAQQLKWLFQISRFPYFWWAVGGFFYLGVAFAQVEYGVHTGDVYIVILWFILFGNIFFNALNDAYDYETDRLNPRKQMLEMASPTEMRSRLITLSILSLLSGVFILPLENGLFAALFVLWALGIAVYNIPPLRLKARPLINVVFGGIWHYVPLSIMGYVLVSGQMPATEFIILGCLFMAGVHIVTGDAVDIEYDKIAGINTLGVWIGNTRITMLLGVVVFLAMSAYAYFLGFVFGAAVSLMFPLYVCGELLYNRIQERKVTLYKIFVNLCIVFWFVLSLYYLTKLTLINI